MQLFRKYALAHVFNSYHKFNGGDADMNNGSKLATCLSYIDHHH